MRIAPQMTANNCFIIFSLSVCFVLPASPVDARFGDNSSLVTGKKWIDSYSSIDLEARLSLVTKDTKMNSCESFSDRPRWRDFLNFSHSFSARFSAYNLQSN